MDLRELKAKGGFVSAEPVPTEVTWKRGEDSDTFTVHVVKQSFGAIEKLFGGADDRSRSASFIAECIRLGNGKERLTYDDAYALDPGLATVLVEAINKVNGTGKVKAKN
jgi:hypothetical protein